MTALRVVLPLPPSVNNQYVTVGRRRVLSAPARTFDRDVAKLIAALRTSGQLAPGLERALAGSYLGVYLVYFFETPRKRDLDGGLKITLDALGRALGFDDRDVVDMHLSKRIDPLHPRVEVDIETIADWEFDRTYRYLGEVDPRPATGGHDISERDAPGARDDSIEHA
jgi:crossover junction endodeoxyribonuclease RusA